MDYSDFSVHELATIRYYEQHADEFARKHDEPHYWGKLTDCFLELTTPARLLEIGCGHGRDARELIAAGEYHYTGVDVVERFLFLAQQNVPHDATFLQQSPYNLEFPDSSFNALWCVGALVHIPKARVSVILSEVARVTQPGSVSFIAVKEGVQGEVVDKDGLFWAYYSEPVFRSKLLRSGLCPCIFQKLVKSERTTWLCYLVTNAKLTPRQR